MSRINDPTMPSGTRSDGDAPTNELHAEEAYCSACNQSFPSDTKICPNDGARLIKLAAERDELIGKVLDERYEIRAPLGKGGMGTVYRGWQLSVDREVAIKVIHPKLSNDRSAVKRFLREARLASRLSQPNIVNVYDFGQSESVLYLVMELLRGHTLGAELGQGRRINAKRTVIIAAQLCDALEAAHAQGIVHRDLKPSNIVILDDPPGRDLIKVLDFGLAKSLAQDSGSLVTNTDALLGTPLYMAPEQIEGKDSDQRADLYSLGCIIYEMLTGKPPFVDAAVSAVLARHVNDAHVPLPAHVPAKLRALIDQLLAKTPEQRVQSAGDVRRVLDEIRDMPGLSNAPPAPSPSGDGAPDTTADSQEALAETHAATPTPPPVGRAHAVVPAPAATPAPTIDASAEKRPARTRYVVLAMLLLVPLAILVVIQLRPAATPSGGQSSGSALVPPADASIAVETVEPVERVDTVERTDTVDAAVATDVSAPVDAGAVKPTRPTRPRPARPVTAPPTESTTKPAPPRPDAGTVELPEIDFLKSKR